jgi:threonyl-tRNA synthetase
MESRSVAVRTRGGEDLGAMPLDQVVGRFDEDLRTRR